MVTGAIADKEYQASREPRPAPWLRRPVDVIDEIGRTTPRIALTLPSNNVAYSPAQKQAAAEELEATVRNCLNCRPPPPPPLVLCSRRLGAVWWRVRACPAVATVMAAWACARQHYNKHHAVSAVASPVVSLLFAHINELTQPSHAHLTRLVYDRRSWRRSLRRWRRSRNGWSARQTASSPPHSGGASPGGAAVGTRVSRALSGLTLRLSL
jgi:hypothetical protein